MPLWGQALNNLFERSDLYTGGEDSNGGQYPMGGPFDCYNNLFFKGSLLFMAASGNSWNVKDNIFDHCSLNQLNTSIASANHNAYIPAVAHLNSGTAGGDVDLSSVTYSTGPLGDYYQSGWGTPLVNLGSRLAGQAGLFHYVSCAPGYYGGREGNTQVDIGWHHVLTTANGVPYDSDGDGIPDYYEDANGDGIWNTSSETDWQNSTTIAGIPDPSNELYDDMDLDGDGLTGRAERLLQKAPLVSDNPLRLIPVTTGEEPYTLTYSIPLSIDLDAITSSLRLIDNGAPTRGYQFVRQTDNTYRLRWNTTFSGYGEHNLQVRLCMPGASVPTNEDGQTVNNVFGPLRFERVQNIVEFDPDITSFGSQAWIYGKLQVEEASYEIRIFDTANNLLKTISGATQNGTIDETWDLKISPNEPPRTDQEFRVATYINPVSLNHNDWNDVSSPYPHRLFRILNWGGDAFTMAFGWNNSNLADKRRKMFQENVVDIVLNPGRQHEYTHTALNGFNSTCFGMWATSDQAMLLDDLFNASVGNFFWSGHGSEVSFGSAKTEADLKNGLSNVAQGEITRLLGNRMNAEGWASRRHPYRLVIMNSCKSAATTWWAEAFGVVEKPHSAAWFQRKGEQSQAFVGWPTDIDYPNGYWYHNFTPGIGFDEYGASLWVLFELWMDEVPLIDCLGAACDNSLQRPLDSHFKIYGDPYLTRTP